MRLLDRVAQTIAPLCVRVPDQHQIWRLFGAAELAPSVSTTPLRYVCEPSVTRLCAEVAGDLELMSQCLDLIRVPATQMWVEWDEAERLGSCRRDERAGPGGVDRVGILVRASECGRVGSIETCWSTTKTGAPVDVAPIVIRFDLDDPYFARGGGAACVNVSSAVDGPLHLVLSRLRFEFRPDWLAYYQAQSPGSLRQTLAECAWPFTSDFSFLAALTLLLGADAGPLRHRAVDRAGLNRSRVGRKPILLDHVELTSTIGSRTYPSVAEGAHCVMRRLHVVRGHLVRRGAKVYWRRPHWRGQAMAGIVATRTVTLRRSA